MMSMLRLPHGTGRAAGTSTVPVAQRVPPLAAAHFRRPLPSPPRSQSMPNSGSSSGSSSGVPTASPSVSLPTPSQQQQQLTDLLLLQDQGAAVDSSLPQPVAGAYSNQQHAALSDLSGVSQQLEHALSAGEGYADDMYTQAQQQQQQQQQQQATTQWTMFQANSEPQLGGIAPRTLVQLMLSCGEAGVTPSLKWLRSALSTLVTKLEAASAVASEVDESVVMSLPRLLHLVLSWGSGQALQQLCTRGVLLLHGHISHMQHGELAHLLHVLVELRLAGADVAPVQLAVTQQVGTRSADDAAEGNPHEASVTLGAVLQAMQQRAQQLQWQQPQLGPLVELVGSCAALDAPMPMSWLASCIQAIGHAESGRALSGQQVLDLAAALRPRGAPAGIPAMTSVQGASTVGVAPRDEAKQHCWLLWWLESTAQAVLVRDMAAMTTPQLLSAAVLLHDIHASASACPTSTPPPNPTSKWVHASTDEDGMCPLVDSTANPPTLPSLPWSLEWAPDQLVLREVEARLLALPSSELVHYTALVLNASLPPEQLRQLLTACLPQLLGVVGQLQPNESVSLLLSLAHCQLQEQQQPSVRPLARQLVAHTHLLLPSCQLGTLVQLIGALAVLQVAPPAPWQDMFFSTLRTRLPLLQADELSYVLACISSLGLQPDEAWVRDTFAASRRLLPDMDAAQMADLVWWLSQHTSSMDWQWAPAYEQASLPQLKHLSPAMLSATMKSVTMLGFHPGRKWMTELLAAVQAQLFAPGAMLPCILSDDGSQASLAELMSIRAASRAAAPPVDSAHPMAVAAAALPTGSAWDMGGGASVDVMMTLIDGLIYNRVSPDATWMHCFTDAMRCKMSLLSHEQMSSLLLFIASAAYRPEPHWWEDYLSMLDARQLATMQISELVQTLSMLHALDVRPDSTWLAGWCTACEERLCLFLPHQLHQVLSCLASCNCTPSVGWLRNCSIALEYCAHTLVFEPAEFVRCVVILDRMGMAPRPEILSLLYSETGQQGLAQAEPVILSQLMWMLQSASQPPPEDWIRSFLAAAQRHLPVFTQLQLEAILAGVMAISAAEREYVGARMQADVSDAAVPALPGYVHSFRLLAREWML